MFKLILKTLGTSLTKAVFGALIGVFRGGLSMALNAFKNTLNAAFTSVKSFNQMGVNTSRAIGLGYRDSIAYTQTLIARTQRLSALYGVTADKIAGIQDSLAKATGKAIMLSNTQAEYAVAINKMLGDGVWDEYSKAIIRSMGGSVDAAQKYAIGAYAKATRVGLSAAEFSSKVAQNLSMANRVSFRGGVDGITKMTALAERLNFNLQSMEASADVFRNDIQTAIESSAKLQALGGGAALYGSNPLAMMYESMYDIESYTERITKMVKGMAEFNAETGMATIKAQNQELMREYSKNLNISYDELASMATNQAKEAFAKNRLGAAFFDNLSEGDEEFKSFILNKAQWNDKKGTFELKLAGQEEPIDLNKVVGDDKKLNALKQEWRNSTLTETEAFLQGARDIMAIDERIAGMTSLIGAMLAEKLMPYLEVASMWLSKAAPKIASVIGRGLQLLLTPGFWKNIGLDFASVLLGGLTFLIYTATMQSLSPWTRLFQMIGLFLDAVGSLFGIKGLKGLGKIMDGRYFAEQVFGGMRNLLNNSYGDRDARDKTNEFLGDARNLLTEAKGVFDVASDYASAVNRGQAFDYIGALQGITGENYRGSGAYGFGATAERVSGEQYNTNNNRYNTSSPTTTNTSTQTAYARTTNTTNRNVTINNNRVTTQTVTNNTNNTQNNNNTIAYARANNSQYPTQSEIDTHNFQVTALRAGVDNGGYVTYNPEMDVPLDMPLELPEEQLASFSPLGMAGGMALNGLMLYGMFKGVKKMGGSFFGGGQAAAAPSIGKMLIKGPNGELIGTMTQQQARAPKTFGQRMRTKARWAMRNARNSLGIMKDTYMGNREAGLGRIKSLRSTVADAKTWASRGGSFANGLKTIGRVGGGAIGAGLGLAGDYFTDKYLENENNYGSGWHYAGRALSNAATFGGLGWSVGGPVGAAIGAVGGAIYGLFKARSEAAELKKRKEEEAKKYEIYKQRVDYHLSQYGRGFENMAFNGTTIEESLRGQIVPQIASAESDMPSDVVAAPVGQPEYVYTPSNTQVVQTATAQTIRVSDISVNVNGTLRIDGGGGNIAQLDMNRLLENRDFVKKLVELVFNERNIQANNGRMANNSQYTRTGQGGTSYNT